MKFTLPTTELRRALYRVHGLYTSTEDPLDARLLLRALPGQVRFAARNPQAYLVTGHAAEVDSPGAASVLASELFAVAHQLMSPAATIHLAGGLLHVGAARLPALGAEDFPPLPRARATMALLDRTSFARALERALSTVCTDETRASLCGVFLEAGGALLSTDGHRATIVERAALVPVPEPGLLLPRAAMLALQRLLVEEPDLWFAGALPGLVAFTRTGLVMAVTPTPIAFPQLRQVLPRTEPARVRLPRERFAAGLERLSSIAEGVSLACTAGGVEVTARSEKVGSAVVRYDAGGPEVSVGFSIEYMRDALALLSGEDVTLEIHGEKDPILIREGDFLAVVMPMRL